MTDVKVPGIRVRLGTDEYEIPPLTLGQLRNGASEKIREHDALAADGKVFEAAVVRGEIIGIALRRNYPEMTDERLLDILDLRNASEAWLVVLGGSGLTGGATSDVPTDPTQSGPSIVS